MNIRYILLSVCILFSSVSATHRKEISCKLQLDMLSTLLHAPRILTLDTQDQDHARDALSANAFAHAVKVFNLYQNATESPDQFVTSWNQLKMAIHLYLGINTIDTMIDNQLINYDKTEIRSHQVNQMLQLLLEALLRGISYYNHAHNTHNKKTMSTITTVTSEIADMVGLMRERNAFRAKIKKQEKIDTPVENTPDVNNNAGPEKPATSVPATSVEESAQVDQTQTEKPVELVQAPEPTRQVQLDESVVATEDIVSDPVTDTQDFAVQVVEEVKHVEEVKQVEEVKKEEVKKIEELENKDVEKIVACPRHGVNPHFHIKRYPEDKPNTSWPAKLSKAQKKWLIKRNKEFQFDAFECRRTENVLQYPTITHKNK